LNNAENTIPTHHPRIMIANTEEHPMDEVLKNTNELLELSKECDDYNIVKKMKELIPTFISNNSIFEEIDKKKQ
jgi:hypothetical protein